MLRKRLIGTIIIKEGIAVQSIGFNKYLPIGSPEYLVENLHRWGVDEIIIISVDRYIKKLGPDINLLNRIVKLGLSTPLTFGGGIRSEEDGIEIIESGAERICIDSIFHDNFNEVEALSARLGKQAIILNIPVQFSNNKLNLIDYKNLEVRSLKEFEKQKIESCISEIILIDMLNEGFNFKFDKNIYINFPIKNIPLILFGGINDPKMITEFLNNSNVCAVAIGNSLNYKEHAVQDLKIKIASNIIRPNYYKYEGLI